MAIYSIYAGNSFYAQKTYNSLVSGDELFPAKTPNLKDCDLIAATSLREVLPSKSTTTPMRPPITPSDQEPANTGGEVTDRLEKQARQQTLTNLPPAFYTKLEKRFEAKGFQFDSQMRLSPSTPKLFNPLTRIQGLLTCSSAIRLAKDFWFLGSVHLNLPKLEEEAALIFNVAANGHKGAMLKPFWNDQLLAPAVPIASTLQNPNPDFWLITPWVHGENVLDLRFEGTGFLSLVHIDVHHVAFPN